VAGLEKVRVLNINELANALKPVVLPGETMKVRVVKEGKESGQGVAYLDDGTMVVIDGGKDYVGRSIDAVVTSVLQTTAGRMIFTRPSVEGNEQTRESYRTGKRSAHQFY
ncbi:TRAM domain-containing protein, partial [bacterium]|nr:TRAM domain-containing protein [bacterium]